MVDQCRGVTEIQEAIRGAELIFICVNIPTKTFGLEKGKEADLKYVEMAARMIADTVGEGAGKQIVVEKSTVLMRAAESIAHILSHNSKPGQEYHTKFPQIQNFLQRGLLLPICFLKIEC